MTNTHTNQLQSNDPGALVWDSARPVHIASLVLQLLPLQYAAVIRHISTIEELTVYRGDREDKLVVVIETQSESNINDYIDQLSQFPGVITVNMAYHHCESNESLNEVIER